MTDKLFSVHMGKAPLALDLSDGSERAEYVDQDYILNVLGRPHRNINLMYTWYPRDKDWPARMSEKFKGKEINSVWDYPYDDYFPFTDEAFECMKDVRRHGQDVTLTLTADCKIGDKALKEFARKLRPYGRMRLRINHECMGAWFTHNKRYTFKEIADFHVRFTNIIHKEAPNVKTIFCAGFAVKAGGKVDCEDDFLEAYKTADVWSADRYIALHYGWPLDTAEKGHEDGSFNYQSVDKTFKHFKYTHDRLKKITGQDKPVVMSEFNADGDVVGPLHQGDIIKRYVEKVKLEEADWLEALTMYQFRDRGRLGLEVQDPNNVNVGIAQPMMKEYKELLNDPYCRPAMKNGAELELPFEFRWGGADDADGLAMNVYFEHSPEFMEITFEEELSLMMEINGRWFYKAPGTKTIDLMPAFFEKPVADGCTLPLRIFATPPEGINVEDGHKDWATNYRATMTKLPSIRLRYEPMGIVG
ncbi:MAG: hypothetical protein IKI75_08120 [Lachnospiraceae bacterium]|nr:hypothetical protein [Lachnospiraceae bacterium]